MKRPLHLLFLTLLGFHAPALADQVSAAVAANFTDVTRQLAPLFERATGHTLVPSFGSTGKLAAQIEHGAPYQLFLSADSERPAALEEEGLAVAGTRFVYAVGRLVLWSPTPGAASEQALRDGGFAHLAIANPKTAPYGRAAQQVMEGLGVLGSLRPRLVTGDSIAQTFQFVATSNAELGFVALSQVLALPEAGRGSVWLPPAGAYEPIEQGAVLLTKGEQSAAARAFLEFLRGAEAREVIRSLGYGVP